MLCYLRHLYYPQQRLLYFVNLSLGEFWLMPTWWHEICLPWQGSVQTTVQPKQNTTIVQLNQPFQICDIIVSSNWIRCSCCKKGFIPLYHMKVAIYQILTLAHFIYIFGLLSEGDFPKWKVVGQGGSVYVSPSFFLLLLPGWTECC